VTDPFVAEIRIFGFNFPPNGWAFCNGQLLPITQNTALFSLIGTFYGGDGKSTFALPDLQGAAPMHAGNSAGPGLTERFVGEVSGSEHVTLLQSEIPAHNHTARANTDFATLQVAGPDRSLARSQNGAAYQDDTSTSLTFMAPQTLAPAGGDQPHNNMQPYLTLNICIALQGVFPQRP
jgi:microcystin-dependent protein